MEDALTVENPESTPGDVMTTNSSDHSLHVIRPFENDLLDLKQDETLIKSELRTLEMEENLTVENSVMIQSSSNDVMTNNLSELEPDSSLYVVKPCASDFLDQVPFITQAVKQNETLIKSEDSHARLDAKENKYVVEDEDEDADVDTWDEFEGDDGDKSDEEPFDHVCAFCDNGGHLLCCDGSCLRSFHPTIDDGWESDCQSLNYSVTQVKAMQNFLCPNCQQKIHQCFACGKLGSSDISSGAEVFQCISATCGYFYHPECVAKLLHPVNEAEEEEVRKKIAGGEAFTCPAHKCYVCKQGEHKDDPTLQFAVCRRCPRSYHRKCLPRKIIFEDLEEEGVMLRAWNDLLPNNRALIYCMKHKIDKTLKTPMRNHIQFPPPLVMDKKRRLEELVKKKKAAVPRRFVDTEESLSEIVKVPKRFLCDVKQSVSIVERAKPFPEKSKTPDASLKPFRDRLHKDQERTRFFREFENVKCQQKTSVFDKGSSSGWEETAKSNFSRKKQTTVDDASKKRIETIMKNTESLVTVEEIMNGHQIPSIYAYSSKSRIDKNITLAKVECADKAVRKASKMLEEGGTKDDAKAVCAPEMINHIIRWRNKLTVYLSPFLHGNRYSSFGRHFTKLDKLKEIVDKLHWYTQNGDTVVDFCCGANDFSLLMRQKLEETGKRCSFRNFDIIHPKNDFCFEKRDWMTVGKNELPVGANLIMGLNPPFGVKAALANKFIDKALDFRPKILILIVPPETQRLERKSIPYDLIWEDRKQFSGKSFYLPGSVDKNNNQIEQWNNTPPVLYLWSRHDWTEKHKKIALEHNQIKMTGQDTRSAPDLSYGRTNSLPMQHNAPSYDNQSQVSMENFAPRYHHQEHAGMFSYQSARQYDAPSFGNQNLASTENYASRYHHPEGAGMSDYGSTMQYNAPSFDNQNQTNTENFTSRYHHQDGTGRFNYTGFP